MNIQRIKCKNADCDTCPDKFKCFTGDLNLYLIFEELDGSLRVCYNRGRLDYNGEEINYAYTDSIREKIIDDCYRLNRFYVDRFTVVQARNMNELISLGYNKCWTTI